MSMQQRTIVVVPCYNEAQRLSRDAFLDAMTSEPKLGFVFVDDGSVDETFGVIQGLASEKPGRVHALRLPRNEGKAEAVRRGVLQAFEQGAELAGYWDADLATPLSFIGSFAARLEQPDVEMVFGSRVRLLGRNVERSIARHYIGRGFATVAGMALGLPIYDTQCGAKLFRADAVFRDVFSRRFELKWSFDVEIFARLLSCQERGWIDVARQCIEYPLDQWVDAPGSKLTVRHVPRVIGEVLSLFAITRRARREAPPGR